MIKKNLEDYIKVYDNFIDYQLCDQIVESLKDAEWKLHAFYDPKKDDIIRHEKELSVTYLDNLEVQNIQNKIWFGIEQYIIKDFDFFKNYFCGWSGYSKLRFNRYCVNTRMKIHCDHINSLFDGKIKGIPTLSIVGSLNDGYEGGKFIMWDDTEIKIPKGSILIFPSNFLYPHRVEDVTKGTRYTFVSWVW